MSRSPSDYVKEPPGTRPREACAGIACDACPKPGRCCTGLTVNAPGLSDAETPEEVLVVLRSVRHTAANGERVTGYPFRPLWRKPSGEWALWCPHLGRDGRCGSYEDRPEPCWRYKAGTDWLCAIYVPKPEDMG